MEVLKNIKPERVMFYFEKLCCIPHGSKNTSEATQMCIDFAVDNDLPYRVDQVGNVVIRKPASEGYENSHTVIIQGHLDMVCQKEKGITKNMDIEGLDLVIDGDFISAEGTTLGGDDGIAVAMALALLEDKSLIHPPIEAVFTVDEEIGLIGATALDTSDLNGKYLINLDSDDEGVFTVSCAGGIVASCSIPVERQNYNGQLYQIEISGLVGGHSGAEVTKGRANADILLGRTLFEMWEANNIRVCQVNGGLKDNAFPTNAVAVIVSNDDITSIASKCQSDFLNEYNIAEKNIKISVSEIATGEYVPMDEISTKKIISALCCFPNGIQSMSLEIPGLAKTSLNLGILKTDNRSVTLSYCVRSSLNTEKVALVNKLKLMTELMGGELSTEGDYPPWEYKQESKLRDIMVETYKQMYNKEPIIKAIHAGLECGILSSKIDGLECISIGPDIFDIHTPEERMSISSVQRVWEYLLMVLANLK